jgi:hypothetical protein
MTAMNTQGQSARPAEEPELTLKELAEKIRELSHQQKKQAKFNKLLAVTSILIGGGGVFSILQWLVSGPQITRSINQLALDKTKYELANVPKSDSIKNNFDAIQAIKEKLQINESLYSDEMNAIKSEITLLSKDAHSSDQVKKLEVLLINKEEAFLSLVDQFQRANRLRLQSTTTMAFVSDGSLDNFVVESKRFKQKLQEYAGTYPSPENNSSLIIRAPDWGTAKSDTANSKEQNDRFAPIIDESKNELDFSVNYTVTFEALHAAGKQVMIYSYLPAEIDNLINIERPAPKGRMVAVILQDGQKASFTTVHALENFTPFTFQSIRVREKGLTTQDPNDVFFGKIEPLGPHSRLINLIDNKDGVAVMVTWQKNY